MLDMLLSEGVFLFKCNLCLILLSKGAMEGMKKILVVLAVIALLGAGAFYMFFKPVPSVLVTEDFIPSRVDGDNNFVFIKMADTGTLAGTIANFAGYFAEQMSVLANPEARGDFKDLSFVTEAMKKYSPAFGKSKIYFSARPAGSLPEIDLYGVCVVKNESPESFMETLFEEMSSSAGDLTMIPYTADLGEKVKPLYQIFDTTTGMTLSTALAGTDPCFLLLSDGTEGLRKMISAAEEPSEKFQIEENLNEMNSFYLSLDTKLIKAIMESQGVPVFSEEPIVIEASFKKDNAGYTVRCYSNAAEIFLSEEQKKDYRPVNGVPEFPGGGDVIGFAHGRASTLDRSRLEQMLDDPQAAEARLGLEYFSKLYGITVEDIIDLFDGRFSMVLGGLSFSPIGEIPGFYVMFQPDKEGIVEKFTSIVPLLNVPVPFKKMEISEWETVYGVDSILRFTIASSNRQLLVGLLDPGQLSAVSKMPQALDSYIEGDSYGIFGLSVKRLDSVVEKLVNNAGPLMKDESLKTGITKFREIFGDVDFIVARGESLYKSYLKIVMKQETE